MALKLEGIIKGKAQKNKQIGIAKTNEILGRGKKEETILENSPKSLDLPTAPELQQKTKPKPSPVHIPDNGNEPTQCQRADLAPEGRDATERQVSPVHEPKVTPIDTRAELAKLAIRQKRVYQCR